MQAKKIALAIMLCLVSAAACAELRIGIVNTDRVMRESAPAVRAQQKLDKEFDKRKQDLQDKAKQLQTMQDTLRRNSVSWLDSERRSKEKEFSDMDREFQRQQREFFEDLNQRQNEERNGLVERLSKAIRQIAEEQKYDLILQEALYANPAIDVTDQVIKALANPTSK